MHRPGHGEAFDLYLGDFLSTCAGEGEPPRGEEGGNSSPACSRPGHVLDVRAPAPSLKTAQRHAACMAIIPAPSRLQPWVFRTWDTSCCSGTPRTRWWPSWTDPSCASWHPLSPSSWATARGTWRAPCRSCSTAPRKSATGRRGPGSLRPPYRNKPGQHGVPPPNEQNADVLLGCRRRGRVVGMHLGPLRPSPSPMSTAHLACVTRPPTTPPLQMGKNMVCGPDRAMGDASWSAAVQSGTCADGGGRAATGRGGSAWKDRPHATRDGPGPVHVSVLSLAPRSLSRRTTCPADGGEGLQGARPRPRPAPSPCATRF